MHETVISNARIVLEREVVDGSLVIDKGLIRQVDRGNSNLPAAIDWQANYLLPGMIELHTDNMEKYFKPRPGVLWPKLSAMMAHDTQMVASGITTVFDAVAVGYDDIDGSRADICTHIIDAIDHLGERQLMRAEHFLHLRCELSNRATSSEFDAHAHNPRLRLVSLMDHAPGQRQFTEIDKYCEYYQKKHGFDDAQMQAYMEQHRNASSTWSKGHRAHIARSCQEQGIPMASHDDATAEHVEEALQYRVDIAEFPTTLEAASLSHRHRLLILMGAPNLIRGHSHSGNVSARELAEHGCLDILSSDYYPSSLLQGAFMLADLDIGYDLAAAVACVSGNPARAVGLQDRGRIEAGMLADLLHVSLHEGMPVLRETWKSGQRVC